MENFKLQLKLKKLRLLDLWMLLLEPLMSLNTLRESRSEQVAGN
jgi:hypothetical protein